MSGVDLTLQASDNYVWYNNYVPCVEPRAIGDTKKNQFSRNFLWETRAQYVTRSMAVSVMK